MPRIRTIKPSFFESEDVAVLPLRARLLWIGLWTHCDDAGRTKDNVKLIKARIWPLDQVSLADIEEDLMTLADCGRIVRYEADDQRYLEIVNWDEHQSINRPTPSKIPAPPSYPQVSTHGALTEHSRQEGKGKEGKGRDTRARANGSTPGPYDTDPEPPSKCGQHLNTRKPPACGACADARREHDDWIVKRNARLDTAPKCAVHSEQLAANCGPCRSERIGAA